MSIGRSLYAGAQYGIEAVLLFVFAVTRIAKAVATGGDVYDAKVIAASDVSDLGGHRIAVHWLSRLINSNPTKPRAYFERALAKLELQDKHAAVKDLERCLQIDPAFPGAKDWYERASK